MFFCLSASSSPSRLKDEDDEKGRPPNLEPDWSLELGRTGKLHILTNVTFVKKEEEELFPTN